MKKIIWFAIIGSTSVHIFAHEVKIRGGAFFPTSKLFRSIFGTAGGHVEIEAAFPLCNATQAWLNFDWFSQHGHSLGFCNPTSIQIPSFSFGLKTGCDVTDCTYGYVGIGPNVAWLWIKDSSICGKECSSHSGVGFVAKSGADFWLNDCVFIELYLDYLFQPITVKSREGISCHRAKVSGIRLGAGLGIDF